MPFMILKLLLILMVFSLPLYAQHVPKEVASKIARKFIQNARQEGEEVSWSLIDWGALVGPTFSKVLTLEAQQAIREYHKRLYQGILQDLQRSWLRRWNGQATAQIVARAEERAATKLQGFYEELAQAFQSKDDLVAYIEKQKWVKEGLIYKEELQALRNMKVEPGQIYLNPSVMPSVLRQSQIEAELKILLGHAGQPIAADLNRIALIMRNLSERHQYVWSYAEARFAMKIQHRWYYVWRNHWSKNPTLRRNWFRLFQRWQAIVKVPNHNPQDATELANFFIGFTHLLSESLAYRSPNFFLSLPWRYVNRSIEQHAKVLSADLELMASLNGSLPEVRELITEKTRQEALLLEFEEQFDKEGFEGLLKSIQGEASTLQEGLAQILKPLEGGYNPLSLTLHRTQKWALPYPGFSPRGHYMRQWLLGNSVLVPFILQTYILNAGPPKDDKPPFVPKPYPSDLPSNDWPEWQGGPSPQTWPASDIGDAFQQILIQQKEQEIQRLQEIQMDLAERLLIATDEERALLEDEIRQNDAQIQEFQNEIENIYKTFGPPKPSDSP